MSTGLCNVLRHTSASLAMRKMHDRAVFCAAQKLEKAGSWLEMHRGPRTLTTKGDNELQKVVKDAAKVAEEQLKGLSSQAVKHALFNRALQGCGCGAQHQSQQQEQQVPPAHAQPPS